MLRMKIPVRTREISGILQVKRHEVSVLPGCDVVLLGIWFLTFWAKAVVSSSGVKMSQKMKNHPYYFHRSTHSPAMENGCWQFRALKMRLIWCFETAGAKYPVIQHHIPEDWTLQPVFREIQNSEKRVRRSVKPSNLSHTQGKYVKGFIQFHRSDAASIPRQKTYTYCAMQLQYIRG